MKSFTITGADGGTHFETEANGHEKFGRDKKISNIHFSNIHFIKKGHKKVNKIVE